MIFTKFGGKLALIASLLGIVSMIAHFFVVGFELLNAPYKSTLLEDGFLLVVVGVSLGVLVEISRSLAVKNNEESS